MKLNVYSIRDTKSETFAPPFLQKTNGEAERSFRQLANDEKSQICRYPEDYDLYLLGEYDDNTGKLSPFDTPQHQVKAVALKQQQSH